MNDQHVVRLNVWCRALEVDLVDVLSPRREPRHLVEARMVCCYLLRERCDLPSFPVIGRTMSRDHTTVLHAVRKVGLALLRGDAWAVRAVEACDAADAGRARRPPEPQSEPLNALETPLESLARCGAYEQDNARSGLELAEASGL
jgi:hypothetical protein